MKEKTYHRRYLVSGKYQLTQVAITLIANLSVALLMTAILSWLYLLAWDGTIAYNHNKMIVVYFAVAALIIIATSSFLSLKRSRYVAGMFNKITLILKQASAGDFSERPIVFRKEDQFRDIAIPLNECLKQLKQQHAINLELRERLTAISPTIDTKLLTTDQLNKELQRAIGLLG